MTRKNSSSKYRRDDDKNDDVYLRQYQIHQLPKMFQCVTFDTQRIGGSIQDENEIQYPPNSTVYSVYAKQSDVVEN